MQATSKDGAQVARVLSLHLPSVPQTEKEAWSLPFSEQAGNRPRLKPAAAFLTAHLCLWLSPSSCGPYEPFLKGARHVEAAEHTGLGLCAWMDLAGWLCF